MEKRGLTFGGWRTFIAACFMVSMTNLPAYWTNLSVYTSSYMRHSHHTDAAVLSTWTLPLYLTGIDAGGLVVGRISSVVGNKKTLLCGIFMLNINIALVYFVIDFSDVLFNVCFGVLNGISVCTINLTSVEIVLNSLGQHKGSGRFISVIQCSAVVGGIFISQFVTFYLNPKNKKPDDDCGSLIFFSQKDIIDAVPRLYLFLACFFFTIQFICYFLMSEDKQEIHCGGEMKTVSGCVESNQLDGVASTGYDSIPKESSVTLREDSSTDLKPTDMIRRCKFYVMLSTLSFANVSFIAVNDYTKSFGQLWIHDDFLLTNLWAIHLVVVVVGNVGWGHTVDRFSVKRCLMLYYGLLPLLDLMIFFGPRIHTLTFCAAILFAGGVGTPLMSIYFPSVIKLFGKSNFSAKIGLVNSGSAVTNLILPIILKNVLEGCGWFCVYGLSAGFNVLSLILVVVGLSEHD